MSMVLSSSAFPAGGTIPIRYSCDRQGISPPLAWQDLPEGTRELALIVDDPQGRAGAGFTHWVLYGIPPSLNGLEENVPKTRTLGWGGAQGQSDRGETGYTPPCPPPGQTHTYFFRLYALDEALGLAPGLTRQQLLDRMAGHILGQAELQGRFGR